MKTSGFFIRAFVLLVFFLVIVTGLGLMYVPGTGVPVEMEGKTVAVGRTPLRVFRKGSGRDILLIHGCPGSIEDWDPVFEALAKKYRVTAYDRPGHGFSGTEGNRYTLEYNAEIALALIKELGMKDVLVVGHSYGAATALALAVKDAENIRGYVLLASPGYPDVDEGFWNRILQIRGFGEGFIFVLGRALGPPLIRNGIAYGFGPNRDSIPPGFVELRTRLWTEPKVLPTRAHEIMNLEKDLAEISVHYGEIKKPVFILQGQQDEITKAAWKLHQDIPHSELTVFDGVGHYVQTVKPRETIAAIERAAELKP